MLPGQQPPGAEGPDVLAPRGVDPLVPVGLIAASTMGPVAVQVDVMGELVPATAAPTDLLP